MSPSLATPAPAVARVLELARTRLGMDVAWLSAFTATGQVFTAVDDGGTGAGPAAGSSAPLAGSYCVRVLDGRLPAVVGRARQDPVYPAVADSAAASRVKPSSSGTRGT